MMKYQRSYIIILTDYLGFDCLFKSFYLAESQNIQILVGIKKYVNMSLK